MCVCVCVCGEHLSALGSEFRSCVKVEVDVGVSPSQIVIVVSVDVTKQHLKKKKLWVQSSGAV